MERNEIINSIEEIFEEIDIKQCCVISGAAMVLHGIKKYTKDIDIQCTKKMFEFLKSKGYEHINVEGQPDRIFMHDKYEFINEMDVKQVEMIDGIPVASISDIIRFKSKLNREKDKKDLLIIQEYIKKNGNKIY